MTTGSGEWDEDDPPANDPAAPPAHAEAAIASAIASVDLDGSVKATVRGVLRTRLEAIAAAAVDAALDEPTREQLRMAVGDAARSALSNPVPTELEQETARLYYPDVVAFVTEQLVPMYRRPLGSQAVTWCPEWWRHAEAIARLEALWRAWEHLRLDPATGMSVWFRDHADHHMAVLLSADGPFKGCKPNGGHGDRLEPFPLNPPLPGLFNAS